MAVATADALMAVEVTVAAMMGNSTGTATTTSDSGIMGDITGNSSSGGT